MWITIKSYFSYSFWAILSTVLAIYFIYIAAVFPYFHVDTTLQGNIVITKIYKSGAAFEIGMKEQDVILKINGEKPEDHFTFKKFKKIEQVKTIDFQHGAGIKKETVSHNYSPQEILNYLVFPSIVFIFCIILSLIVSRKKDDNSANKLLIYFLLAIGLGYVAAGASSRGDLLARIVTSFSFILSPVLLLHLLIVLFKSLNIKLNWKWRISWFYAFSIFLMGISTIHELSNWYYTIIDKAQLFFFFTTIFIIIYVLFVAYSNHKYSDARPTIKVLLVGIILSFAPFSFMHALPYLLFNVSLINPEISSISLFVLPLTILYLIRKERIIDIDFILFWLKKDLFFSLLAGLFFFILSTTSPIEKTLLNSFYVTIICLVIFTLRNPMFFRTKSKFIPPNSILEQQLNRFFKRAEIESSPLGLAEVITNEIQRIIPEIQTIQHFELHRITKKICIDDTSTRAHIEPFAELLISGQSSIGTIIPLKGSFCMLIHEKHDTSLYLFCSDKNNRTNLNPVEKAWLETLANYSNVLLANQYTIENVIQELRNLKENDTYYSNWLSNFLFSFAEKERVRLASDLHDTVLQELLLINIRLKKSLTESLPADTHKEMDILKEKILDCIHTTRETCYKLSPPFLVEFGLILALEQLIRKIHLQSNFHVQFDRDELNDHSLSDEYIVTLYRIVQELFTNAMKHSRAKAVILSLKSTRNSIKLFYADNGIGMDIKQMEDDYSNFNGLTGIRERVKSLNGDIEFSINDGLQVTIDFPLEISNDNH
ncbi:ATP-binding protein [Sporosarcina limicola]|uniref:histidine kinase n=1 Tax=Sporosarcina limicola TaxID=34101 RepID=A0A927RDL8_9BACL|nr:ATP-binding protein [Sporosarcina limicola]MBE1555450.1 two-component system sensor histidine kinase ComP [Sporosarcina limicola]